MIPGIILRPDQANILSYKNGKMGISAVPGSGKTFTLSLLATQIIEQGTLADDQEVLIVTLVNSAVENFYQRISKFIEQRQLIPNLGYRVRTLHGLAHDIVRERPELAGLDNNFIIIDEREAESILTGASQAWLRSNPVVLDSFLRENLEDYQLNKIRRDSLPELVEEMTGNVIRFAKDLQLSPELLQARFEESLSDLPLAKICISIYRDYQRALAYRGAVDFDDLIRLALGVLRSDELLLERLRYRWPYILEDEAQDSSRLQEEILNLLAGPEGNWVRVGDPNQAIFETFTTANPKYLRNFLEDAFVTQQQLPISGRSTQSIISLANYLVHWTQTSHPQIEVRDALHSPPDIIAAPLDDPQPNPIDDTGQIFFSKRKYTPIEEIMAVCDSIERWLPQNSHATVAVLAPRNMRAFEVADELRRRGIACIDHLLRSTSTTRFSAGTLGNILRYLADPQSSSKLAKAYLVYHRDDLENDEKSSLIKETAELIQKNRYVEEFIWPIPGKDWLENIGVENSNPEVYDDLINFRSAIRQWQNSILLPVDQIVLNLAHLLLKEPAELAIAHKLAMLLRTASELHPAWRIPELTEELAVIARNERRFLGFAEDDTGFDPERHRGKVVVSTIHKAKGLEWDRVYILSANNYDFPSGMTGDTYIAEKWFLRDHLNLPAEAIAQTHSLIFTDEYNRYQEGQASQIARTDYIRERLRLFYVGITRARKELIITWNNGRRGESSPSAAFVALQEFWDQKQMNTQV
jgi:DNA helicase II / ATP-dependent DNA helicase PcrA